MSEFTNHFFPGRVQECTLHRSVDALAQVCRSARECAKLCYAGECEGVQECARGFMQMEGAQEGVRRCRKVQKSPRGCRRAQDGAQGGWSRVQVSPGIYMCLRP